MRAYVLTERERRILTAYVEKDLKLDGFSVVLLRLNRSVPKVMADVELIKTFLDKTKNGTNRQDQKLE